MPGIEEGIHSKICCGVNILYGSSKYIRYSTDMMPSDVAGHLSLPRKGWGRRTPKDTRCSTDMLPPDVAGHVSLARKG
jgi:hypothetical protein